VPANWPRSFGVELPLAFLRVKDRLPPCQRHHGMLNIALRIRGRSSRPFAVLFIIRRIRTVVDESAPWASDLVEVEAELIVARADFITPYAGFS